MFCNISYNIMIRKCFVAYIQIHIICREPEDVNFHTFTESSFPSWLLKVNAIVHMKYCFSNLDIEAFANALLAYSR